MTARERGTIDTHKRTADAAMLYVILLDNFMDLKLKSGTDKTQQSSRPNNPTLEGFITKNHHIHIQLIPASCTSVYNSTTGHLAHQYDVKIGTEFEIKV